PPPAEASTFISAISFWSFSCIFCACFINALMSMTSPSRLDRVDVHDPAAECVQERAHHGGALRLPAQALLARLLRLPLGGGPPRPAPRRLLRRAGRPTRAPSRDRRGTVRPGASRSPPPPRPADARTRCCPPAPRAPRSVAGPRDAPA